MGKYRQVGNVPMEVEKGEARVMLGPGEFIDLTADEAKADNNKALIESGWLIEAAAEKGK